MHRSIRRHPRAHVQATRGLYRIVGEEVCAAL